MEDASGLIARQYEAYAYPEPFADIAAKLETGYVQMGDPALYSPALWPEGRPRERLKILVAGCGTVQAAVMAYTNRGCDVVGVDLSETSLQHQRLLQDRHQLSNLKLFRGDLRDVGKIGQVFDYIICTGVLHHMTDPATGLRALSGVLAAHGVLVGMVYAPTRRAGVYMLQDAFRRLGVKQDRDGVAFVRRTIASLHASHPVHSYLAVADELKHDAALVDTFLNPQDRAYTVPQLLEFIEAGALAFQAWAEPSPYWPESVFSPASDLHLRISALPDREQWAAIEMLTAATATHVFYARPVARSPSTYAISFEGADWLHYAPHLAPGVQRTGATSYARGVMAFDLDKAAQLVVGQADGTRSMRELLAHPALAGHDPATRDTFGRTLLSRLWKMGHVMILRRPRR